MYEMSLKDLETTQLKEDNQELKDRITTKESEDSAEEIRTLKEKVARFLGKGDRPNSPARG